MGSYYHNDCNRSYKRTRDDDSSSSSGNDSSDGGDSGPAEDRRKRRPRKKQKTGRPQQRQRQRQDNRSNAGRRETAAGAAAHVHNHNRSHSHNHILPNPRVSGWDSDELFEAGAQARYLNRLERIVPRFNMPARSVAAYWEKFMAQARDMWERPAGGNGRANGTQAEQDKLLRKLAMWNKLVKEAKKMLSRGEMNADISERERERLVDWCQILLIGSES